MAMRHACALGLLVIVGCGSAERVDGTDPANGASASNAANASGTSTPTPSATSPSAGNGSGSNINSPALKPTGLGAPYPIVLVHGMAGFDQLTIGPVTVDYWNHVKEALAEDGEYEVFETVAPPYDTSEVRAGALVSQIQSIIATTGHSKVNIIGHSQGGMDARVLASPNGYAMGSSIATITTISTPHHGSMVADVALGLIPGFADGSVNQAASALLNVVEKTAYDIQSNPDLLAQANELTTSFMANTFNPKYIDDANVVYASYAGRTNLATGVGVCDGGTIANDPTDLDIAQPILQPTALLLADGQGIVNDGLVTVESAKWGTFMTCVPADHLQEIGNINVDGATATSFDYEDFYKDVVKRLRAQGF